MLDDGTVVYPEPPAEPSAGASSGDFSPLDFAAADFRQQSPAPPSPVTDLKIELNDAPAQSDSTPVPQTVALEARSQTHLAGSGGLSVEGFPAGLTVKRAKGRRSARTVVGRSVLKNTVKIEETGAVFIALLEGAIEELQRKRPNSDEGKAAVKNEIAECEDLKRRVEAFLATASQFSAEKAKETSVVKTTLSLQEGIADWWTKDHREICDLTFRFGLFGAGLGLCVLAGAGGPLSALIPGAMFGGKPVVEAIKAWRKGGHS
jgi:hypothetical protein